MNTKNIIDYVMKTPQNTNKTILEQLINSEVEKHGPEAVKNQTFAVSWFKGVDYETMDFNGGTLYKISNLIPSIEDLEGGIITIAAQLDGTRTESLAILLTASSGTLISAEGYGDGAIAMRLPDGPMIAGVLPGSGIYYGPAGDENYITIAWQSK